jgi:hypothetical protein
MQSVPANGKARIEKQLSQTSLLSALMDMLKLLNSSFPIQNLKQLLDQVIVKLSPQSSTHTYHKLVSTENTLMTQTTGHM